MPILIAPYASSPAIKSTLTFVSSGVLPSRPTLNGGLAFLVSILIIFTVGFTAISALIARNTLAVMRDTAQRQLRAYIGIRNNGTTFEHGLVVEETPLGRVAVQKPMGQVQIYTVNYGQTPAHRATMYIHIREKKPEGKPDYSACKKETGPQIIHPEQAFGKIVGKEKPTDTFFLCGYVDYIDAFET